MAVRLDWDDLHGRHAQLAAFIAARDASTHATFVTAFAGSGGPFAVYAVSIGADDPVPAVVFVCGLAGEDVLMVELEDGSWSEAGAVAVAEALADDIISGHRSDRVLRVTFEEEDTALERVRKTTATRHPKSDATILDGPFKGFPARVVDELDGDVTVEVVLFGKPTRLRVRSSDIRRG